DLGGHVAEAMLRAMLAHDRQPGLLDELVEAGGARSLGLGVGIEAAFLGGLGHQVGEVDAGIGARLLDAVEDVGADLIPARLGAQPDRTSGHIGLPSAAAKRDNPANIAGRNGPFWARWLENRPSLRLSALILTGLSQGPCQPCPMRRAP